jgi:hypothetical protein
MIPTYDPVAPDMDQDVSAVLGGAAYLVAGTRWTIESCCEAAKRDVGVDHDAVRSWTGWYRHSTLAMWALALRVVLRAGAMAVEAFKKSRPPPRARSSLAAFKASRGLSSRCACPRGGGGSGGWSWPRGRPSSTCARGPAGAGGISAERRTTTSHATGQSLGPWPLHPLITTVVLGRSPGRG